MEITGNAEPALASLSYDERIKAQKKLVEELKVQWKLLWSERFDDKVRAEGVSVNDYLALQVERGLIIHATKDFKALSFKEVVERHLVDDPERFVGPEAHVGGWKKFIKTEITGRSVKKGRRAASYVPVKPKGGQAKKGGRGWLHTA